MRPHDENEKWLLFNFGLQTKSVDLAGKFSASARVFDTSYFEEESLSRGDGYQVDHFLQEGTNIEEQGAKYSSEIETLLLGHLPLWSCVLPPY